MDLFFKILHLKIHSTKYQRERLFTKVSVAFAFLRTLRSFSIEHLRNPRTAVSYVPRVFENLSRLSLLTLSCILFKNGQVYFKNLFKKIFKIVDHFSELCTKGLREQFFLRYSSKLLHFRERC